MQSLVIETQTAKMNAIIDIAANARAGTKATARRVKVLKVRDYDPSLSTEILPCYSNPFD